MMYVTDFPCPTCKAESGRRCQYLNDIFRDHGWHYWHDARWRVMFREKREIENKIKMLRAEIRRLKKLIA